MSKTILIVDDCATTRRLVSLYLRPCGYDIVQAENGVEALEKLAQQPVDLVVTDMNMPLMDGVALTQELKNTPQYRAIPVLMLTTESTETEQRHGVQAGVDAYLIKPVTQAQLTKEAKRLLETACA